MRRCEQCETTLPRSQPTGRFRRFCSNACRQKAYRTRAARQERHLFVVSIVVDQESRPPAGVQRPTPSTDQCSYGTEPNDEWIKQQLLQS